MQKSRSNESLVVILDKAKKAEMIPCASCGILGVSANQELRNHLMERSLRPIDPVVHITEEATLEALGQTLAQQRVLHRRKAMALRQRQHKLIRLENLHPLIPITNFTLGHSSVMLECFCRASSLIGVLDSRLNHAGMTTWRNVVNEPGNHSSPLIPDP